jgi:hypothetical protein
MQRHSRATEFLSVSRQLVYGLGVAIESMQRKQKR